MIRLTFPLYCQVTVALTALVIYHAHSKYDQFYPTGVYLATAKHALLAITNFAIVLAYLIGKLVIKLFLEKVHERELDLLNDRLKTSITDTILALTIFREHFNAQFVFLLLILLFFQVFHWLTKYRVEYLEHSPYDFKKNVKLFTLLTILLFFDLIFLYFAVNSLFEHGINAMMLFSLEYGLLLVSVISTIISFFINIEGIKREGRWDQKGLYILYLEFFSEGIKTIMYALFFIVSLIHIALPIHIIRQLFISFRTFYRRFQDLLQYQSIMNERFQDATDEELENSDKICIVCREDMTSGKKLPCGHILHLHCLRSWLERQQTCPICRALVIVDDPNRPVSLLNRLFRRRPPVQPPPVPAAPVPAANAIPAVAQQPVQPVVQQPQQPQPQQQQPNIRPISQPPRVRVGFDDNNNNNNNNTINHRNIKISNKRVNMSNIPLSNPVAINPQLQNDKDVVLHIMAMQNHIQFLNSQLDHIKNYLIIKNNSENLDSKENEKENEKESENENEGDIEIEGIVNKDKIDNSDNNINNGSNNIGKEDTTLMERKDKTENENIQNQIENSEIIDDINTKDENVPTAIAEGDSIEENGTLMSSPHTNQPIIHDEQKEGKKIATNDFMDQLRQRVTKYRENETNNDNNNNKQYDESV